MISDDSDVTIIIAWGRREPGPRRKENLTIGVCVLTASHPFCRDPCSPRHSHIELRPINDPTMASKCLREKKSCVSLTLHQELKMIELSENSTRKAKTGPKPGLWDL